LLEAFACVNDSSKAFGFGVGGMDGQGKKTTILECVI
jgi:hypothetical protein